MTEEEPDYNAVDDDDDRDDDLDVNTIPAANAQAVLTYLARAVVEHPDEVRIDVEDGRRNDLALNVRVADGDMGRVIGKRGRVAQSIRTVVRAAAVRDGVTVDVEFVD